MFVRDPRAEDWLSLAEHEKRFPRDSRYLDCGEYVTFEEYARRHPRLPGSRRRKLGKPSDEKAAPESTSPNAVARVALLSEFPAYAFSAWHRAEKLMEFLRTCLYVMQDQRTPEEHRQFVASEVNRAWFGYWGKNPDTMAIVGLLNAIADGDQMLSHAKYGTEADPEEAEVTLDWAASKALELFEQWNGEAADRATSEDFARVLVAWRGGAGRPKPGQKSRWQAVYDLAKQLGLQPQSIQSLKQEWARWRKENPF